MKLFLLPTQAIIKLTNNKIDKKSNNTERQRQIKKKNYKGETSELGHI